MGYTNIMLIIENNAMYYLLFSSSSILTEIPSVMLENALEQNKLKIRTIKNVDGENISQNGGCAVIKYCDNWITLDSDAYRTLKGCDHSVMVELAKFYTKKLESV